MANVKMSQIQSSNLISQRPLNSFFTVKVMGQFLDFMESPSKIIDKRVGNTDKILAHSWQRIPDAVHLAPAYF